MLPEPTRYNIEGLSEKLEFEMKDMAVLFSSYIKEMREEISEVSRLYTIKDWSALQRTVHNIKGVSSNLGVTDVYDCAFELDILLKENQMEKVEFFIERMKNLIYAAEEEIINFFLIKGYRL